ncbi:MAG: HlyD family efflux transporter periplasmic adaptor subunit [Zoogloea sp.]|nr:HlyD family efflux transporter periplasmic adaptor subunit [Zoogloea sp.]
MKPSRPALFILLGALLCACSGSEKQAFHGYVEGEYLYLAAPQAGYLKSLDVLRGGRVAAGQQVFAVAPDPDLQALSEAEARAGSAKEKLANLQAPHRAPEIASLEAQLKAAQAAQRLSQTQLDQQQALAGARFVSQSRLDEARAARDRDAAQVESVRQQIAVYQATLGRKPEVRGAEADLQAAAAQAAQKRWQVERKTVTAPAAGELSETYYRPGEWVPAGQPVASLLPDTRRRLRFFVPETQVAQLRPGLAVEASCDGCSAPIAARIDFIAPQAEYTPPVIYSHGTRDKLMFRVEAVPAPEMAAKLRPGLPIDVKLAAGK